jgi:hypothetical protein
MTTSIEQWRHTVDLLLWFHFQPPLLQAEAELYYETGLSPELAVERIMNAPDRPKEGECGR